MQFYVREKFHYVFYKSAQRQSKQDIMCILFTVKKSEPCACPGERIGQTYPSA